MRAPRARLDDEPHASQEDCSDGGQRNLDGAQAQDAQAPLLLLTQVAATAILFDFNPEFFAHFDAHGRIQAHASLAVGSEHIPAVLDFLFVKLRHEALERRKF